MVRQTVLAGLAALSSVAVAQISDDFESGWDKTKWPTYAPSCQQGGSVSLDTTTSHSGSASMKVVGGGNGFCGHMFFGTTDVPTGGDVYVRAWIKPEKALTSSHVTFLVMPDAGLGTDKHLRFGSMSEVMIYNRESDDATLPSLSPQGVASSVGLSTEEFQCLEYHLGSDGTIETWLNGESISGLTAGPDSDNPNASTWEGGNYKPDISGVYFGWEAYGGDTNTFWYDDIVIGSTRAGCGDGASPPSGGGNPPSSTPTTTSSMKTTTTMKTSTKTSSAMPTTSSATSGGPTQSKWGQCGGKGWSGPTTCVAGTTCKYSNDYYSQCL